MMTLTMRGHDSQGGIFEGHPQRYAELAWTLFRIAFWMGAAAKTLCRLYLLLFQDPLPTVLSVVAFRGLNDEG